MPGDPGATVVTNARAFYTPRAAAGATGTRHSPRPLFGRRFCQNSGASRCENAKVCRKLFWVNTSPHAAAILISIKSGPGPGGGIGAEEIVLLALFADIHANRQSLSACLDCARTQVAEQIISRVGYPD